MARSEAKAAADARYYKKAYDKVTLNIRKDSSSNLEVIRTHAEAKGESVSGYIMRVVDEAIARDNESYAE